MVINFSVSIGFGIQNEIKNKFSGLSGDYYISNFKNENFSSYYPINLDNIDDQFFEIEKFKSINKVIYNPGIIPLNNDFEDIVFKGVDKNGINNLNQFIKNLAIDEIGINEVIISDYLAKKLDLEQGDYLKFLFFKNQNSKIKIEID